MKKIISFLIGFILLVAILPTFSFSLREWIEIYFFRTDHFSKEYFLNLFMNKETYTVFITKIDPPNGISWSLLVMYSLFSLLGGFGGFKLQQKYSQNEKYASHGTSRWQTKNETKRYFYNGKIGWLIGTVSKDSTYKINGNYCYHEVDNVGGLNMQLNVVGPPGSKKTTGFVLPNIIHLADVYQKIDEKADLIITDPKSELHQITANYLKEKGYEVRVLDFIHLKYGDGLNTLEFISEEKELMEIADGFVSSVDGEKQHGDPVWENAEKLLLASMIGFVKQVFKNQPEKQTLDMVDQVLNGKEMRNPKQAEYFFENNGIEGAAKRLYDRFLLTADAEKMRAGIIGGLSVKMSLFSIDGIQKITSFTTVDIRKLGAKKEKPMALFIMMPDNDLTFRPIINVMVSTIFKQLYKTAYQYNNKLYNPVYFIIEEIANIGKLSNFEEMLGTMRGRRIYPMMIWQDLNQIKKIYGNSWEGILSKCDTHIYLGINDEFTAKYVSGALGKTTIRVQGVNRKPDNIFGNDSKSESYNYQQRSLMFEDELKRMDRNKLIISQGGRNPVILNKIQYEYWKEDKRVCDLKMLDELPLLDDQINRIYNTEKIIEDVEEDEQVIEVDEAIERVKEENVKQEDSITKEYLDEVAATTEENIPEDDIINNEFIEEINKKEEHQGEINTKINSDEEENEINLDDLEIDTSLLDDLEEDN